MKHTSESAATIISRTWRYYTQSKLKKKRIINNQSILRKIQVKIDNLPLDLNVFAKLPKKDPIINKKKIKSYLQDFEDIQYREIAEKFIKHHITYISMKAFLKSLEVAVNKLNYYLINNHLDHNLSLIVERGHSSEWVGAIAMRYLANLPNHIIELDNKVGRPLELLQDIPKTNKKEKSLFLFDDCVYSGTQISKVILNIAKNHVKNSNDDYAQYDQFDIEQMILNDMPFVNSKSNKLNLFLG